MLLGFATQSSRSPPNQLDNWGTRSMGGQKSFWNMETKRRIRVRLVEPQCVPDSYRLCHWMEPLSPGVPCDVAGVFRKRIFSLKMCDLHIFRRAITNYTHNRHQKRGGRVPLVEQIEPRKWSIGINSHDERSFSNKVKPLLIQGISTQVVLFPIFPGSWKSTLFAGPQQPSGDLFAGPFQIQ